MGLILSRVIMNTFGVEVSNFFETIWGKIILALILLVVIVSLMTSIVIFYLSVKENYLNKKNLKGGHYNLMKYFIDTSKDWCLKNKTAVMLILLLLVILLFNLLYQ